MPSLRVSPWRAVRRAASLAPLHPQGADRGVVEARAPTGCGACAAEPSGDLVSLALDLVRLQVAIEAEVASASAAGVVSLAAHRAAAEASAALEAYADDLSDEEVEDLLHDWRSWARPGQLPPDGSWSTWLLLAGRGYGKTRAAAEAVREIVGTGEVEHVALIAKTPADARDVMIEGPSGLLAIHPNGQRPSWMPSQRRLTWPNGARATVYSGENPDQLRGPQHQLAWADELATYQYPDETWDNLALGLRLPWRDGGPARCIVTTTPRPIPVLRRILALPGCHVSRGTTYENRAHLDPGFMRQITARYEGTRLGRQELMAELLDDTPGALWTRAVLDAARGAAPDPSRLRRVVVGVDPAATSGLDADETGIVVVGVDEDGHLFVLADRSVRATPLGWATEARRAAADFGADCIVAEANNGGEMVELTIRTAPGAPCKVTLVHASRGKRTRAEPVSSLYEQRRVTHCGSFPALEDQQCTWTGSASERSPDRMDALVWAVTELGYGEGASSASWYDANIGRGRNEWDGA